MLTRLIYAFVIFFVIFTPLELLFPLHSQKFFRRGWWADFLHFFVTRIFVNLCLAIAIFFLLPVLDQLINPNIQNLIAAQPFVLQLTIAFLYKNLVLILPIVFYILYLFYGNFTPFITVAKKLIGFQPPACIL